MSSNVFYKREKCHQRRPVIEVVKLLFTHESTPYLPALVQSVDENLKHLDLSSVHGLVYNSCGQFLQ